jgi:hypothetical protein
MEDSWREMSSIVGGNSCLWTVCWVSYTQFSSIYLGAGIAQSVQRRPGWQEQDIFLFATACTPALGSTQPPIQRITGALSPGLKRPWREVDHSPPFSTEVKNGGTIPPVLHTSSWRGRDNFTFYIFVLVYMLNITGMLFDVPLLIL